MCEVKCLLSAGLYFVAKLILVVLNPLQACLDVAAKKAGKLASKELGKITEEKKEVAEKAEA